MKPDPLLSFGGTVVLRCPNGNAVRVQSQNLPAVLREVWRWALHSPVGELALTPFRFALWLWEAFKAAWAAMPNRKRVIRTLKIAIALALLLIEAMYIVVWVDEHYATIKTWIAEFFGNSG